MRRVTLIGELHGSSKLSERQARAIRARYDAGQNINTIAALFGLTAPNVRHIGKRTSWREFP